MSVIPELFLTGVRQAIDNLSVFERTPEQIKALHYGEEIIKQMRAGNYKLVAEARANLALLFLLIGLEFKTAYPEKSLSKFLAPIFKGGGDRITVRWPMMKEDVEFEEAMKEEADQIAKRAAA